MGINTTKYVRKPLYVEAVQVTEENFDEMVSWCNGAVEVEEGNGKKFIRIWVHNPMGPRQTKAFVGDWILRHMKGFKIYTQKAFEASFDEVPVTTPPVTVEETGLEEGEVYYKPPTEEPEIVKEEIVTVPERALEDIASPEGEVKRQMTEGTFTHPDLGEPEPKPVPTDADVAVSDSPSAPPPVSAEGKRVLTLAEQQQMGPDEVRELLRSGEAILAQDLQEHVA